MYQHTPDQLLVAPRALLRACLRCPWRQLAILEETFVTWLHFLEQVTTNLLQSAELSLKVHIVSAANLHLLNQVSIVSCIFLGDLSAFLSSTGFLLGGCGQFRLR